MNAASTMLHTCSQCEDCTPLPSRGPEACSALAGARLFRFALGYCPSLAQISSTEVCEPVTPETQSKELTAGTVGWRDCLETAPKVKLDDGQGSARQSEAPPFTSIPSTDDLQRTASVAQCSRTVDFNPMTPPKKSADVTAGEIGLHDLLDVDQCSASQNKAPFTLMASMIDGRTVTISTPPSSTMGEIKRQLGPELGLDPKCFAASLWQ